MLSVLIKRWILSLACVFFTLSSLQFLNADIIVVNSEKFITLGSTKDEVLDVLGTPTSMTNDLWHYGGEFLVFNGKRVSSFSDSNRLKVKIFPNKNNLNYVDISGQVIGNNADKPIYSSSTSKNQSSTSTVNTNKNASYMSSGTASGYGEISQLTGKPKTVHVKGYYRKDGTYVRSHYRSKPRK